MYQIAFFTTEKSRLFDKDLDKYESNNKSILERRFEVILTSFSSSNDYNS